MVKEKASSQPSWMITWEMSSLQLHSRCRILDPVVIVIVLLLPLYSSSFPSPLSLSISCCLCLSIFFFNSSFPNPIIPNIPNPRTSPQQLNNLLNPHLRNSNRRIFPIFRTLDDDFPELRLCRGGRGSFGWTFYRP